MNHKFPLFFILILPFIFNSFSFCSAKGTGVLCSGSTETLPFSQKALSSQRDSISAKAIAENFIFGRYSVLSESREKGKRDLHCIFRNRSAFVFSALSQKSFVIVSADSRLPMILGYGKAGWGNMPQALLGYLGNCSKVVASCNSLKAGMGKVVPISPLLTMVRHQGAPYNGLCPYYRYEDESMSKERCQVGCVATALEEIITYHTRNVVLKDTLHGWETEHYSIENVMPGTVVNTGLILDD